MYPKARQTASAHSCLLTVERDASCSFLVRRMRTGQPHTYGEASRAAMYSYELAKAAGYETEQAMQLYRSALLADIGLLQVEEGDTEEHVYDYLQHPLTSAAMLKPLAAQGKIDLTAIEQHHENLDGTGYPVGLTAKKITFNAQILRISGSLTVLTRLDQRTGRTIGEEEAVGEIYRWSGIMFEETLVELLATVIGK